MIKGLSALVATLFIVQAAPALAFEDAAPKPKKERKICKQSNDTATRMTARTCLTASQWRALAKSKQNTIAEAEGDHLLRSNAEIPDRGMGGASGPTPR